MKSDWPRAFLAITCKIDFSHISSFHKMLKGHKYFHSTPFPDKTNQQIFLKSPKTPFMAHFWSFLPEGDFFQKNQDLSRTSPCGPLTPYKIPEKPNGSIPRKLPERRTKIRTNRRTDRRMEGQTLIHRTLPAMTGCPKKKKTSA